MLHFRTWSSCLNILQQLMANRLLRLQRKQKDKWLASDSSPHAGKAMKCLNPKTIMILFKPAPTSSSGHLLTVIKYGSKLLATEATTYGHGIAHANYLVPQCVGNLMIWVCLDSTSLSFQDSDKLPKLRRAPHTGE